MDPLGCTAGLFCDVAVTVRSPFPPPLTLNVTPTMMVAPPDSETVPTLMTAQDTGGVPEQLRSYGPLGAPVVSVIANKATCGLPSPSQLPPPLTPETETGGQTVAWRSPSGWSTTGSAPECAAGTESIAVQLSAGGPHLVTLYDPSSTAPPVPPAWPVACRVMVPLPLLWDRKFTRIDRGDPGGAMTLGSATCWPL